LKLLANCCSDFHHGQIERLPKFRSGSYLDHVSGIGSNFLLKPHEVLKGWPVTSEEIVTSSVWRDMHVLPNGSVALDRGFEGAIDSL
jgi:hypothetical protein